MSGAPEIRPFRPGEEERVLRSFNLVFREVCGEGYVDRDLATWRWLFADNPAGQRIHVAVAPDGTIAAQYAALPSRARTPLGPTVFSQIVDSFTHPDWRRGLKRPGVFVQTSSPALHVWGHELGDGLCYGYPVRAAERIGQRYLDYRVVRVVDFLVQPVREAFASGPADVATEPLGTLGGEVDELAAALSDDRQLLVERDRSYLDWRYRQSPVAAYELWGARRGGRLVGLAVLRLQHDALVPDACAIADWAVPGADPEVADALLAVAARRARSAGRKTLLAVFADPAPEHRHLRSRGFSIEPSTKTLERRLTYRIFQPGLTEEMLADLWYYTLGDSDLV